MRAVEEQGYAQPTPIQIKAIPAVLAGRDLLAAAQTGTGKTAGFVLPILQLLMGMKGSPSGRRLPRVLILTPTRELAAQVEESVQAYGAHLPLQSTVVYGGVGMQPQVQALRRGVDILVATPGRLLDHSQQKTVDLSEVKILVLDEADRMLDMGFIRDVRRILGLLPRQRQNLLFSATFSAEIRELAASFLHDPEVVEVARRNAPSELVTHVVHPVDQARKRELLAHLITSGDWRQVLVFTRTKHGANRLAQQLERDGISADAIHGNKSQSHRTRTLADFKRGELRVLVATDLAARGLDIEELPHVVNFDLPHVPEDYVHRIGRTGRAGAQGEAISLVSAEDAPLMTAIENVMKGQIERRPVAGFAPTGEQRSAQRPAPGPSRRPVRAAEPRGRRPQPGRGPSRSARAEPAPRHGKRKPLPRRPSAASPGQPPRAEQKRSEKLGPMAALLAGARRLIG
ncbi:MAG TPA: DEAD/DEAH box helicase [Burkholderiales bacterium]|nr:DEAD/DEAH box helicase [Burkholderiales bacterium]